MALLLVTDEWPPSKSTKGQSVLFDVYITWEFEFIKLLSNQSKSVGVDRHGIALSRSFRFSPMSVLWILNLLPFKSFHILSVLLIWFSLLCCWALIFSTTLVFRVFNATSGFRLSFVNICRNFSLTFEVILRKFQQKEPKILFLYSLNN